MRVYLEITHAPRSEDVGRRFEIEPGSWRVLGRAARAQDITVPLTRDGDRALDPERMGLVERAVGADPARVRQGARRAADIELDDDGISRTHAMVFAEASGALSVVDLMSTNGTRVNDRPAQDADLQHGDTVGVGGTRFRVVERS